MRKSIISLVIAVSAILCGCSFSAEPTATVQPIAQLDPVLTIYDDYALLDGHTWYQSPDGSYSIQIPENSEINDTDPSNVAISIAGTFADPDSISITKNDVPVAIDTTAALLELLKDDNSIDITGFFVLNKNGGYAGYKYTYTAMDDPQLKGIKSVVFSGDGTAYEINATIYNGGDEANVSFINTIVDTFVNHM